MTIEEEIREYIKDKKNYFSIRLNNIGLLDKVTGLICGLYPASIKHHHAYNCGLRDHTYEVMKICENIADIMAFTKDEKDNLLFLALIHDLGKMDEYEYDCSNGKWFKTDFGNHIEYGYYKIYDHGNIDAKRLAAHHGRKEWGALFEPFDKISWALHLADMISAKCE